MTFETLKRNVLSKPKGTFSSLVWEKQLPVRKSFPNVIVTKRTSTIARVGVIYDNMKVVKGKRESGQLPTENAGLSWGTWETFPYFIQHKGKRYLRISLDKNNKMSSEYFLNGRKVSKDEAIPYCTKAAFPNGNEPDVLSISVENIIAFK